MNLPFAGKHEADAGDADIRIAVAICAGSSYEDTLASFLDGSWEGLFEKWNRDVSGPWCWRRKLDMVTEEKLFRQYLKDGYAEAPVYKYKTAEGVKLSAPWELLLKCRLVASGFSETEVLNGYLPSRWYEYFTSIEIECASKLTDKKNWKPMFFTQSMSAAINRLEVGANG